MTGVVPFVYVNVNGAVPVNVNVTEGSGVPVHTDPPPDVDAVGNVFTVTLTGVPRLVALQPLASLNAVTEYVPTAAVAIVKVVVG